jgi:hypothetical protein
MLLVASSVAERNLEMAKKRFLELQREGTSAVTATVEGLKKIELAPGFPLPASYCEFATTFGYGLLGELLILYIPMTGGDSLLERCEVLKGTIQYSIDNELFEYEPDGSEELAQRLIPFGISENGHIVAWDPKDKTGAHEYRVYAIGSKCLAIRDGGADLYQFVESCLDKRVKKVLGSGYDPLPATFRALPAPKAAARKKKRK